MKKLVDKFKEDLQARISVTGLVMIIIIVILLLFKELIINCIAIPLILTLVYFYIIPSIRLGKIREKFYKECNIEERSQNEYRVKYIKKYRRKQ